MFVDNVGMFCDVRDHVELMLIFVRESIFVTMNLVHNANVLARNPKNKRRKVSPNERHHHFSNMSYSGKQSARRELVLVEIFTRPCEQAIRVNTPSVFSRI
jgi:hypothetical protein